MVLRPLGPGLTPAPGPPDLQGVEDIPSLQKPKRGPGRARGVGQYAQALQVTRKTDPLFIKRGDGAESSPLALFSSIPSWLLKSRRGRDGPSCIPRLEVGGNPSSAPA